MSFPDGALTHQFIGHNASSSAWSLAYYCIRKMVFMIEPIKGLDLLLNLAALLLYPALDSCEA